jgi:LacI family transcriptional regulator
MSTRNERPKRASRADVARLAGTSTAVVSYVVNNGPAAVSDTLRLRVEAAIKELDYRPNPIAQALRGHRSNVIALLVPDSSNRFYAGLARAVQVAASQNGYELFLANTDQDPVKELSAIRAFIDRRVDGAIIIASSHSSSVGEAIAGERLPHVMLDRKGAERGSPMIALDNLEATRMSTEHLLDHGHERILHIGGPDPLTAERHSGYTQAMDARGLARTSINAEYSSQSAFDAITALVAEGRFDYSAVLTSSDVQAIGVYRAAADAGLRIPDDLAVMGFDGIEEAQFMVPRLTTVRQPIESMAEDAVATLRSVIEGTMIDDADLVHTFHAALELRESCGPH